MSLIVRQADGKSNGTLSQVSSQTILSQPLSSSQVSINEELDLNDNESGVSFVTGRSSNRSALMSSRGSNLSNNSHMFWNKVRQEHANRMDQRNGELV